MRGRRHVGEIELRDLRDGVEDVVELPLEALDLVLAQLEPREVRDVQKLFPVYRHRVRSSQNEEGPCRGPLNFGPTGSLDRLDVCRLRALVALNDFELHALAFGQRLVAVPCDCREVDEDVVSAFALDEAVALLVREPLYGALSQAFLLADKRRLGHRAAELC